MKVEGNNEILLKTLKSLQKHYIRIEIYRLMSSQTKISSLELYSTFLQNYKSCRKKMKRKGLPYMHSLPFQIETFTAIIKKNKIIKLV